jgi:hypothetical protein
MRVSASGETWHALVDYPHPWYHRPMSLTWASLRAWGEEVLEGQPLREFEQGISAVRCGQPWMKTRPLCSMRKD